MSTALGFKFRLLSKLQHCIVTEILDSFRMCTHDTRTFRSTMKCKYTFHASSLSAPSIKSRCSRRTATIWWWLTIRLDASVSLNAFLDASLMIGAAWVRLERDGQDVRMEYSSVQFDQGGLSSSTTIPKFLSNTPST